MTPLPSPLLLKPGTLIQFVVIWSTLRTHSGSLLGNDDFEDEAESHPTIQAIVASRVTGSVILMRRE